MTALAKRSHYAQALSLDRARAAMTSSASATTSASAARTLLRFITCGSVDDGKSTLIGRLLFDSNSLADDQIASLRADSARGGASNGEIDYSLLLDGLSAEREQGITIDVAYRYFSSSQRSFIVADTPGHEQYTRNMATGASTADLAIILIDARKGILTQTRRHTQIVAMLGVRHIVLAVNKMDLVGHSREVFDTIEADYRAFVASLGFASLVAIPLSAKLGENVRERAGAMPWYHGPALLDVLETTDVGGAERPSPARFVVQWVNRPQSGKEGVDFRGFSGFVASGRVSPGDEIVVLPSGVPARVARIVTYDGDLPHAVAGQSVTLTLDREVDVSRGDVLAASARPPVATQRLAAKLLWMSGTTFDPSRPLLIKLGARTVPVRLAGQAHGVGGAVMREQKALEILDITTGAPAARHVLAANDIARVELSTDTPVVAECYNLSRDLGGFILIDRLSNETVALGMVEDTGPTPDRAAAQTPRAGALASDDTPPSSVTGLVPPAKSWIAQPFEASRRSLVKAITWRATGSVDTFILAYLFTGHAKVAAGISVAEMFTKIVLYYGHERLWTRIKFGQTIEAPTKATDKAGEGKG